MRRAAVGLGFALTLFAGVALAQRADGGASEADALVASIDAELERAQTEDCTIACHALESMRRAAERLCALEPDARCKSAQDKVKGALERVRAACPGCAATSTGAMEAPHAEPASPPPPSSPSPTPAGATEAQAAPGKHGGCAGCALSSTEDAAPSAVGLAIAAAVFGMRRRLKRRER